MTRIIVSLSEISDAYDAVFCDLWGCLHNGVKTWPAAAEALRAFRAKGGTVVILTNAPRQRASVERQLDRFDTPRDSWDAIATSGDSARRAMFQGVIGERVWFIGQPHDEVFFEPIAVVDAPVAIERTDDLDAATGILCCGPFDPYADPALMAPQFETAIARGLPLLCANPDLVVDRGDKREWCAGELARLYTEMGGQSLYFGKPHAPVYDLSRARIAQLGKVIPDDRILCIGDGIHTDITGARLQSLDSLFITGGLAARDTRTTDRPDPKALDDFLAREGERPTYSMAMLR